jgi:hypothetical protein
MFNTIFPSDPPDPLLLDEQPVIKLLATKTHPTAVPQTLFIYSFPHLNWFHKMTIEATPQIEVKEWLLAPPPIQAHY